MTLLKIYKISSITILSKHGSVTCINSFIYSMGMASPCLEKEAMCLCAVSGSGERERWALAFGRKWPIEFYLFFGDVFIRQLRIYFNSTFFYQTSWLLLLECYGLFAIILPIDRHMFRWNWVESDFLPMCYIRNKTIINPRFSTNKIKWIPIKWIPLYHYTLHHYKSKAVVN